jgi:MFS family permease
VFTLDRIGRRWTLYWGAVAQGIALFLAGGLSRLGQDARADGNMHKATMAGNGAVFFVYLYTAVFGATWLTVPWIYPAEIFPLRVRAKGNAWGVFGWSIGNGWLTLLCPVMFNAIGEKTLYIFGASNFIGLAMVWAFYPESARRTLEEMDMLFASDSWFVWDAEREFKRQIEANPELEHARHARRKDAEEGPLDAKRVEDTPESATPVDAKH